MSSEILVVGAGAIGAFYGSRLAQIANAKVSVICRSNYNAVKSQGFHVESPQYGSYAFKPARVFANPEQARTCDLKRDWDFIIVATKSLPDVSDDSSILEGLVGDKSVIVLVQNGLGVEIPYSKRFPNTPILSAVTIASAAQPDHGKIKHNRWTRISIGPYLPHTEPGQLQSPFDTRARDDREAVKINKRFVQMLQQGGIKDAEAYDHAKLQMVRWHKIAINAAMNPSSVLSGGSTNRDMSVDPELRKHLKGVMDEVLETAPKVLGIPLSSDLAPADRILSSTAKNTSGSVPSMQIDWEAGKRMEIEVILGNPIRAARAKGFEMPRLQTLYALLKTAQINRDAQKSRSKI